MDFPSFGDATFYSAAGKACAAALASEAGSVFADCYDPMRPLGVVAWNTVPHLVARDPVDAAYATLALNVLLLVAVYLTLLRVLVLDPALRPGSGPLSARALSAAVFVPALLILVPHLPVTLSDLPSLAAFLPAVAVAARILLDPGSGSPRAALFRPGPRRLRRGAGAPALPRVRDAPARRHPLAGPRRGGARAAARGRRVRRRPRPRSPCRWRACTRTAARSGSTRRPGWRRPSAGPTST